MFLEITKGFDFQKIFNREIFSKQELIYAFGLVDWNFFHLVTLYIDDSNWMNVSGNIQEDGLAVFYEEKGVHNVIDEPPDEPQELLEILIEYYHGTENYKSKYNFQAEDTKIDGTANQPEIKRRSFTPRSHKAERLMYIRNAIIAGMLVLLIVFILFRFNGDGMKFFGLETTQVKAIVIETKKYKSTEGVNKQLLIYEYDYNGYSFRRKHICAKESIKRYVGDSIDVKIAIKQPHRAEVIGR